MKLEIHTLYGVAVSSTVSSGVDAVSSVSIPGVCSQLPQHNLVIGER